MSYIFINTKENCGFVNESGRDRKSDLDRERRFSTGIGSSDHGSESVSDNTQCLENRIGIVFT